MEQDEYIYEYRMGEAVFRFEAHGQKEAKDYRPYALLHFQELLGPRFTERDLSGPLPVSFERGSQGLYVPTFHGVLSSPNSGGITR